MKLENQVSSLELSKKLKELGVPQESLFSWMLIEKQVHNRLYPDMYQTEDEKWYLCQLKDYGTIHAIDHVSAFTVAELGMMLPGTLWGKPYDIELYVYGDKPDRSDRQYGIELKTYNDGSVQTYWTVNENNEADARAKMLIYLIENNLLDPKTLSI